ncbi:hypothetical protein [Blastococcus sp. SYSU DS0619]
MARQNQPGVSAGRRRWIIAGLIVLVLLGAFAGELRDPPFDLVRFLFTLLLNGLAAWFLLWFFTKLLRLRGND